VSGLFSQNMADKFLHRDSIALCMNFSSSWGRMLRTTYLTEGQVDKGWLSCGGWIRVVSGTS